MVCSPAETAVSISKVAKHVFVDQNGIDKLAAKIADDFSDGSFGLSSWFEHEVHPKVANEDTLNWIFFVDLLNFSFWSEEPKYAVEYQGNTYTGYFSLCAAVNKAINGGLQITKPEIFKDLEREVLSGVLASSSSTSIPLFDERLQCLHEAGQVLCEKFDGSTKKLVEMANGSAVDLLRIIVENFICFRDESMYEGHRVFIYKRAQIFIADLWLCFKGEGLGAFRDIEKLTAFADYRVPQVLHFFGVLTYSKDLMDRLEKFEPLPNGSPMEVEIRALTIHACELLKSKVRTLLDSRGRSDVVCNSILIDNFLWDYRRNHAAEIEKSAPMHRTRCIYY